MTKDFDMVRRHMMNKEYADLAAEELLVLLMDICNLYVVKMWPVLIATLKAEGVKFDEGGTDDGTLSKIIH